MRLKCEIVHIIFSSYSYYSLSFADHVFEVMMYVDNTVDYDKSTSVIDSLQVIQEIVKKSGMRARTVSPPDLSDPERINKDATKWFVKSILTFACYFKTSTNCFQM